MSEQEEETLEAEEGAGHANGGNVLEQPGNAQTESGDNKSSSRVNDRGSRAEFSLFVRSLPLDCTMEMLTTAFSQFGKLLPSTRVIEGRSIGFVDFETVEALNAALKQKVTIGNSNVKMERAKSAKPSAVSSRMKPQQRTNGNGSTHRATLSTSVAGKSKLDSGPRKSAWSQNLSITSGKGALAASETNPRESNGSNHDGASTNGDFATPTPSASTSPDRKSPGKTPLTREPGSALISSRSTSPATPSVGDNSVYFGGVPEHVTLEEVRAWLDSTVGNGIGSVRLTRTLDFQGRRQGFIDFADADEAKDALLTLRKSKAPFTNDRLRLELARSRTPARSPNRSPAASFASSRPQNVRNGEGVKSTVSRSIFRKNSGLFYVRVSPVPPGTTYEDIHKVYIRYGKVRDIIMQNVDLNSGKLEGEPFKVAPDLPDMQSAVLSFENVEDAVKASSQSGSESVEQLQIVQDGESGNVIVGPFNPSKTLAQIARVLTQVGPLSGAKLVKKTTACIVTFENEKAAQRACENAVTLNGASVIAVREHELE